MKKQGADSVFFRLLWLLIIVIVIIYLLISGLFVRFVLRERAAEEKVMFDRLSTTALLMEEQIHSVMNVQFQLFSDSQIKQLSLGLYEDAYERSVLALDILDYIGKTQRINSVIDDIMISFPLEGIELSANNGFDRKDFSDWSSYYGDSYDPNQLIYHQDHIELILSYPLSLTNDADYVPDYVIRCILSTQYLQDNIAPLLSDGQGAFWVYRSQGQNTILESESSLDTEILNKWLLAYEEREQAEQFSRTISVKGINYFVISCAIPDYNLVLIGYQNSDAIPWKVGNSLFSLTLVFLCMALLFLVLIFWTNRSVNKPIRVIMDAFESVRAGQRTTRIYHDKQDEFGYMYASFNHMADRIDELAENVREQEALLQKAERIQLQSQINPHFLYNSFYNIKFMARNGDTEQVEALVTALAKYYRFLNKETSQTISLSGETEHMRNYITIQQMRFGDIIQVEAEEVPAQWEGFKVPKLILQPIVENAYNYGFCNTLSGGILRIRYLPEGRFLRIEISDNGGGLTPEKIASLTRQINTFEGDALNHALTNIQRRLKLNFGESCGISLSLSEGNGLTVTIVMDGQIHL